MKKFLKKKTLRAFTLIELLIVISIIGILASIILVNLSEARREANRVAYAAQLDSLRTKLVLKCSKMLIGNSTTTNNEEYTVGAVTLYNLNTFTNTASPRYLKEINSLNRVVGTYNAADVGVCGPTGNQNFAIYARNRTSFKGSGAGGFGVNQCVVWIRPNGLFVDRECSGGASYTSCTPAYATTDNQLFDSSKCMVK